MIPVQVAGISQEFNFQTLAQDTFAVFVLPNGFSFRSPITDETAQALVQMAVSNGTPIASAERSELPAPTSVPRTSVPNEVVDHDGTPTRVFGGDGAQNDDAVVEDMENALAGEKEVPVVTSVRPKFQGRDEYGYPIMSAPGGVEPTSVTGSLGDGDEDGVRSV